MARILALSSQVARGHVGLSAIVPTLQALGNTVIALPTVLLSNHPGHSHVAGTQVAPETLRAMLDALEANGWLVGLDGVITGYLPTVAHVILAAEMIRRVRALNPDVTVMCDPVLGDDPKGLYIAREAAEAIRDHLIDEAFIVTPNRFELSWLSGLPVETIDEAIRAAATLRAPIVLATSVPKAGGGLTNLARSADGCVMCHVPKLGYVPHGTGDLLSALYLHHRLAATTKSRAEEKKRDPLAPAVGQLQAAIDAADGRDELDLSGRAWLAAHAWPLVTI
jgi:pyridoxine kinase